jgi:hypothetical protein
MRDAVQFQRRAHNVDFFFDQRQCSLSHKHRHINILKEQAKIGDICFALDNGKSRCLLHLNKTFGMK